MAAASDVPLGLRVALPTAPGGFGWTEDPVNGRSLGGGGKRPDDVEIHRF
jgi:hypothetical protein